MALDVRGLEKAIKAALDASAAAVDGKSQDADKVRSTLAADLASAIDSYVKEIEVTSDVQSTVTISASTPAAPGQTIGTATTAKVQ